MFDKWLYAIRNLPSLLERPRALYEKVFQRLFEAAEIAKFDRRERYEYEESLKAYRDWFSVMETAELRGEERGHAKGLKKGLEEGLKEGHAKGLAEGRMEERLANARNLKKLGVSPDIITRATGLTPEEIAGI